MGIRRPFSVGDGFVAPETPEGGLYALINGTGEYYSAGFEGATQKHPAPLAGGQRIFLGTGGLTADVSTGYNVITGTGVSQTAAGLEVTLNTGNPEVIIDLPVFGAGVFWCTMVELALTSATPGTGALAGLQLDSNDISYLLGQSAYFNGTTWVAQLDRNGTLGFGSDTTTIGAIEYVASESQAASASLRRLAASIGEVGGFTTGSMFQGTITAETLATPTTWDLRLRAKWVSGSDLAVVFKSISVKGAPLQVSTVP